MALTTYNQFFLTKVNMEFKSQTIHDFLNLLKLSILLMSQEVTIYLMDFAATLFLAHLTLQALAGGAIAYWLYKAILLSAWATLSAVCVLVARKHGENQNYVLSMILRDGLVLGLMLSISTCLILIKITNILTFLKQSTSVIYYAQTYINNIILNVPFFLTLIACTNFLIGLRQIRVTTFISILCVPFNLFITYILVFGKFGIPALGIAGIGWGMTLTTVLSIIMLLIYFFYNQNYRYYLARIINLHPPYFLKELFTIGSPFGLMYCLEVAWFFTLSLLMGHFGDQILASNQITLQFAGILFNVSLSFSQALSILISNMIGRKDIVKIKSLVLNSIIFIEIIMLIVAFLYWFLPDSLIRLDLDIHAAKNLTLIQHTRQLLAVSAFYLLLESITTLLVGALRGFKDTAFPLISSFIGLWGIALPLGYVFNMLYVGSTSYWWGMVIGELICATMLFLRFNNKLSLLLKG